MKNMTVCPLCKEGKLSVRYVDTEVEHQGKHGTVKVQVWDCDVCGSELAGATDLLANKRSVLAFKKQVEGHLPGVEIRNIRKHFGISQRDAAKLFGGGPVAFSKYENDDISHSDAMDTLLRLVKRNEDVFRELVAMKNMTWAVRRQTGYNFSWNYNDSVNNVVFGEFNKKEKAG